MKHIAILLIIVFSCFACSRDWNNPFETDSDLSHPPNISGIELVGSQLELSLDYSYSDGCTVLFERKRTTAFEPLLLQKISASVFADTTLNMEQNYNLVYRFKIQKSGYTSNYSNEKTYSYVSNTLNAPTGLSCSSIEMQGVRLNWIDKSSKETGYRIDKNVNGAGFIEAADLPANTTTWLDAIPGMPATPQSIIYRIRAYNTSLNSAWAEQNVLYSGLGAPSNLHITNPNFWELTLAWTRNSTIATGYQVERRKDSGTWVVLGTVGASTSLYIDSIALTGSYDYRVCAISNGTYSTYSNIINNTVNSLISYNGLMAYYPFDGNTQDASGNGNHVTNLGASLTEDRFGNGNAYLFDGIDDYMTIDNSEDIQWGTSSFSYSMWIKISTTIEGCYILSKSQPGGWTWNNKAFYIENNKIGFNAFYIGMYTTNEPLTNNEWYHLTLIHDNQANRIKIYVNGTFYELSDPGMLYDLPADNESDVMYIGKLDSMYFPGSIDDIRLYSRVLTNPEIQALYHEGGWTGSK